MTLTGPETRNQINNPNPIVAPNLPWKFELEGRDSLDNVVAKYGFELRQWFVHRADKRFSVSEQARPVSLAL
ncbi:hypothetical protein [Gilliamella sp. Bif1-4]|uniref:hypothetical protein n=1 Tax=Gilliamella sp. Bif1-4 TaxID=3120233 RepID=UPI00080ECF5D|nr:hypothetical protein [Gilliamella apicola]OCG41783.1 hypothetical protein A9G25_03310 [Gilliamella apicola]